MVNQEMLDYIKQQLEEEKTIEEIKNSLLIAGWQTKDVEKGLNMAASSSGPTQSPSPKISPSSRPSENAKAEINTEQPVLPAQQNQPSSIPQRIQEPIQPIPVTPKKSGGNKVFKIIIIILIILGVLGFTGFFLAKTLFNKYIKTPVLETEDFLKQIPTPNEVVDSDRETAPVAGEDYTGLPRYPGAKFVKYGEIGALKVWDYELQEPNVKKISDFYLAYFTESDWKILVQQVSGSHAGINALRGEESVIMTIDKLTDSTVIKIAVTKKN